jgi:hypothetical protein
LEGFGTPGGPREDGEATATAPVRLIPMKVGDAEVFIEAVGESPTIEQGGEFRAVGGLSPTDAFEKASDALKECVKIVGDRLGQLGDAIQPEEIGVEFTITFDVEGQASIIPILLTGKAKTGMGIKVTALWKPGSKGEKEGEEGRQ